MFSSIFENLHYVAIQVYSIFMSPIPENQRFFILKKITETLKMNIVKICKYHQLTSKNKSQKEKFCSSVWFYIFFRPHGRLVLPMVKAFCCFFLGVFAFKQTKEHILIQLQPLQMIIKKIFLLILGLPAEFSQALQPKSRQL